MIGVEWWGVVLGSADDAVVSVDAERLSWGVFSDQGDGRMGRRTGC